MVEGGHTPRTKLVLVDNPMKYASGFYQADQTLNNTKGNDRGFRAELLNSQESHLNLLISVWGLKNLNELKSSNAVEHCNQKLFLDAKAFNESSIRTFCYLGNCIVTQEEFLSELAHQYMLLNFMVTLELVDVYTQDLSTEKKINSSDDLGGISDDNAI